MAQAKVVVSLGREKLDVAWNENMTFGELRRIVEEMSGSVEGGLRLLHKGKSFPDTETLGNAGVKCGTKMMALRTKKQIEAEQDREKKEKLSRDYKAMSKMTEKSEKEGIGSASEVSSERKPGLLGDDPIEGQTSVLLIKGRSKFRANIDLSSSVGSLKEKASNMDGIRSESRDMKLLFRGKCLEDAKSLSEYGAKDGASLMVLFSARHYDAKEDSAEIGSIKQKVVALEVKARSLVSKASHRFLDNFDMSIARGEIEEELLRLKDNLRSVKSEDQRKPEIEGKLSEITSMLASLK